MIGDILFLASGSLIDRMVNSWEQIGVFSYMLPLLLLFSLIYGIMMRIDIFKNNKGINAVIALSVAFMAMQFDFVGRFFAEIFPRLGVGLAIILVALILLGLVLPDKAVTGTFLAIGAIVFIIVISKTGNVFGWTAGYMILNEWPQILALVLFVVFVILIIRGNSSSNMGNSILGKTLGGSGSSP